jgi:hypothetical protein
VIYTSNLSSISSGMDKLGSCKSGGGPRSSKSLYNYLPSITTGTSEIKTCGTS